MTVFIALAVSAVVNVVLAVAVVRLAFRQPKPVACVPDANICASCPFIKEDTRLSGRHEIVVLDRAG